MGCMNARIPIWALCSIGDKNRQNTGEALISSETKTKKGPSLTGPLLIAKLTPGAVVLIAPAGDLERFRGMVHFSGELG